MDPPHETIMTKAPTDVNGLSDPYVSISTTSKLALQSSNHGGSESVVFKPIAQTKVSIVVVVVDNDENLISHTCMIRYDVMDHHHPDTLHECVCVWPII